MAVDGSIVIDTKMDTSKLPAQLKKLSSDLSDGAKQAEKLFKASMAGIAVAIGTLTAATSNYLGTTDKIDKMSQSIGLSKEAYQEWDYVLSQNGASIESLEMGMKTLIEQIDKTNNAADKNSTALGQLGISAMDSSGNLKAQEDVLKEVITALQNMPAGTEKARLSNELLGRSGTELAATLNQTAESTEALRQRAYDLGIVLGDDVVNAGVVLGDTLADIKLLGGGLLNSVIAPLIPQIQEVANSFIEWALEGDRLKEIIAGAFDAIKEAWENGLIKALAAGILTIGAVTTAIAILNAVMAANPISLIIIGIGALVTSIVLIYENWDKVFTFISETVVTIKERFIILGSKMKEAFLVAVYSIKNGFVQLGLYIAESFMNKIVELLNLLSNIPFIGKYFATASDSISGFVTALELAGDEAQDSADAVIQAAKDQQDATESGSKAEIEAIRLAREARRKAAEEARNPLPTVPTGTSTTPNVSSGLGINISGIKMPMGIFDTFVDNAAELGDDWGKQLTNSMSSAIDNTSIGVSDSIGAVMDNIGAAITIAVGVVKKIFSGIKAVAKFDPAAMYESFLEIIDGLSKLFEKIGSLPIYIDAGKKVLFEFAKGLLENREANAETFRNVLVYMLETAIEVLPGLIGLAFLILTDLSLAIIDNLPLILETAIMIVQSLVQGILSSLPTLITSLVEVLPMLLTTILSSLPILILGITGMLPEIINALQIAIIQNFPAIISAILQEIIYANAILPAIIIASIIQMLIEIQTGFWSTLVETVASILDGMLEGFNNSWASFYEGIVNIWNAIIDSAKDAFQINSPSKVFANIGFNIMEGLRNAILGYDLWGQISGKFSELRSKVSGALSGIKDSASTVSTSVGDWFKGLFNAEGTNNFRGGTAIINEEGAEMVTLPSGSKIMTASATAQMQDRAIGQLLSGMRMPSFATAGGSGSRNIMITTKVDAPFTVDGAMLGRLVFQNIDKAVV
jgi:hypothetical protein